MAHLVFQTAYPGDLLLSIPLIKRLRAWDPDTPITLACRPGLGDFFLKHRLVDRLIEINKKSSTGRASAIGQLQGETWDAILVPHQSVRTALWMTRLRSRRGKVGFANWWNLPIFNRRVAKPMEYPDAIRQLSLLTELDSELKTQFSDESLRFLKNPQPKISPWNFSTPKIPSWASMQVLAHRAEGQKIFMAPGSVWATKRWTVSGFSDLANILVGKGYQVEFIGSSAEREICNEIASRVGSGVINRAGQTTFAEMIETLATGQALICNDSGAMHAASVSALPTVAVFGPTTLSLGFRPWNERSVVVQKDLNCRPCGRHGPKQCPLGTHECMVEISAKQVWLALKMLLGKSP